jgi:hypothetical protein
VQALGFAEEIIRGDRRDPRNIFRWGKVRLNLPGCEKYDPSLPWVSKVRAKDGKIAVDLFAFMDDFRPVRTNKKEAWLAGGRAASILNHLGIQDAPRNRGETLRELQGPGPELSCARTGMGACSCFPGKVGSS